MKVVIILEEIKDPINYTKYFLEKLKNISSNLELSIYTNNGKILFNEISESITKKFPNTKNNINSDHLMSDHLMTPNSHHNMYKQILVSKKLGRKIESNALVNQHLTFLNFYHSEFSKISPDLLIIWNGITHSFQTAAVEIAKAKQIPIIYLERGLIPGSVFYDFVGVNAQSSIAQKIDWQETLEIPYDVESIFPKLKDIILETGGGLVATNGTSKIELENYCFFPLQRDTDSNMLFNSPYVKNMYSILSFLNSIQTKHGQKYSILVRPHPEDPSTHYTKNLNFFPNLTVQSDGNLLETIQKSSLVMTVNSTVGFTSFFFDKPVLALGKSIYSGKNLCIEPANYNELEKILATISFYSENTLTKENISKRHDFICKVILNNHISFMYDYFASEQLYFLKNNLNNHIKNKF